MALLQLLASGMFCVELQGAASFPRAAAARYDRAVPMQRMSMAALFGWMRSGAPTRDAVAGHKYDLLVLQPVQAGEQTALSGLPGGESLQRVRSPYRQELPRPMQDMRGDLAM